MNKTIAIARGFSYVPILGLSLVFVFLRTIAQASILSVAEFASYSVAILISSTFCMFGALGLHQYNQRNFPVFYLKGNVRKIGIDLARSIVVVAFIFFIFVTIIMVSMLVMEKKDNLNLLLVGVFHGALQQIFLLLTVVSRSQLKMRQHSNEYLFRSFLIFIIGIIFSIIYGSAELAIISEGLVTLVVSVIIGYRFYWNYDMSTRLAFLVVIKRISKFDWRQCLLLLNLSIVTFVLLNIDRWISVLIFNQELIAIYSFSIIFLYGCQSLQAVLNASIYPTILRLSNIENRKDVFKYVLVLVFVLLLVCGVLYFPYNWVVFFVVPKYFSQYMSFLDVSNLIYCVGVVRLADFFTAFLMAYRQDKTVYLVNISGLILYLFIGYFIFFNKDNVVGVSDLVLLVFLVAVFVYFLLLGFSLRFVNLKIKMGNFFGK